MTCATQKLIFKFDRYKVYQIFKRSTARDTALGHIFHHEYHQMMHWNDKRHLFCETCYSVESKSCILTTYVRTVPRAMHTLTHSKSNINLCIICISFTQTRIPCYPFSIQLYAFWLSLSCSFVWQNKKSFSWFLATMWYDIHYMRILVQFIRLIEDSI